MLPEYIKDKEEREAEVAKQKKYNAANSTSLDYEVQARRAKEEGRCPPPRFDKILDRDAVANALKARSDFNNHFKELRDQKLNYLNRLNESEMYKKK